MNCKIIKKTTPLSVAVLIIIGVVSVESQANGDNELFLSNHFGETVALGSMYGKPPYNRARINRQRKQKRNYQRRNNQQIVEMSALEINQNETTTVFSEINRSRKSFRGGHPDRSKHHGVRY